MRGSWSTSRYLEDIVIVAPLAGVRAPAEAARVDPIDAALRVAGWFPEGLLGRGALIDLVRHVERSAGAHAASASTSWLVARVADALRQGTLEAYVTRRTATASTAGAVSTSAPTAAPIAPKEEKTWIAVRLVGKDGKPVPFKRYRIELPDGSIREGMLDDKGAARINGIDPGACTVSFPGIDAAEWRAA